VTIFVAKIIQRQNRLEGAIVTVTSERELCQRQECKLWKVLLRDFKSKMEKTV